MSHPKARLSRHRLSLSLDWYVALVLDARLLQGWIMRKARYDGLDSILLITVMNFVIRKLQYIGIFWQVIADRGRLAKNDNERARNQR